MGAQGLQRYQGATGLRVRVSFMIICGNEGMDKNKLLHSLAVAAAERNEAEGRNGTLYRY